ncbi:hypothetical protein [Nostoc sp.]|uniref:hypothetical protein n=1 Tax=Nostoc sp. TaxID=1180 RepID=UPI002FFCC296
MTFCLEARKKEKRSLSCWKIIVSHKHLPVIKYPATDESLLFRKRLQLDQGATWVTICPFLV